MKDKLCDEIAIDVTMRLTQLLDLTDSEAESVNGIVREIVQSAQTHPASSENSATYSEEALEAAANWAPIAIKNHDPTHLLELREAYATGFYLGASRERARKRTSETMTSQTATTNARSGS